MSERKDGGAALMRCPLCGEPDFDAYGLAMHFRRGWCPIAEVAIEAEERRIREHDALLSARVKP